MWFFFYFIICIVLFSIVSSLCGQFGSNNSNISIFHFASDELMLNNKYNLKYIASFRSNFLSILFLYPKSSCFSIFFFWINKIFVPEVFISKFLLLSILMLLSFVFFFYHLNSAFQYWDTFSDPKIIFNLQIRCWLDAHHSENNLTKMLLWMDASEKV